MASAHPRLLLFGSPGAGKSSLLGALAQASEKGTPALKGQLVEKSTALAQVQKSTYDGKPAPTQAMEEYNIRLAPVDGEANGMTGVAEATLLDCSGQEALELLTAQEDLPSGHPLREPILGADAIVLLVDVSLPGKQLLEQLQQLGQMLTRVHEVRGRRADVGDLPVYLVLSKCDTLAKKEENFGKWMQRIEDAKHKINEKFRESLKDEGFGFGSLDLKLTATAIKRPLLADRPAKAQEPFGVAELFQESLEAAADFFERRRVSQIRLTNVLAGLFGLIAILGLGLALLAQFEPDTRSASLEEKIHSVMPKKDTPPPARVYGTLEKLKEKRETLADIQQDPSFGRLPDSVQAAVVEYRGEIDEYLKLSDAMKTNVKFPFMAESEEDFLAQEKRLQAFTVKPDWKTTAIGARVEKVKREFERVHEELKKEKEWLDARITAADKLIDEGTELLPKLRKALADERKLQPKIKKKLELTPQEEEKLKEAERLKKEAEAWQGNYRVQMKTEPRVERAKGIPGVTAVAYGYLDRFESIKQANERWKALKARLTRESTNLQEELNAGT